jgi:hypothetical protein
MVNEAFEEGAPAPPERHLEGVEREVAAQVRGRLPADDEARVDVEDERDVDEARPGTDIRVGVGPRRGAGLSTGPFPRPALQTGRARLRASGSPRDQAALAHGVSIRAPR